MLFLLIIAALSSPERTASSINPQSLREQILYAAAHEASENASRVFSSAYKMIFRNEPPDNLKASDLISPYLGDALPGLTLSSNSIDLLNKNTQLANRALKGHSIQSINEIDVLSSDEIDLARALFLIQYNNDLSKVLAEEAALDLLAYEILCRAGNNPTPEKLVEAANQLIFYDLGFRFPPMRSFHEDVDKFSLLSSVLASRRGVCLGVSTLYLCLAQRIALPLDIYTPPGHIFIAYRNTYGELVGIETTCRGVSIPLESYCSIHLKQLRKCSMKSVIGMSYVNQASLLLKEQKWEEAEKLYARSLIYQPESREGYALLALCELAQEKRIEALKTIEKFKALPKDDLISLEPLFYDLIHNTLTPECITIILNPVDDTFESYTKRINEITTLLKEKGEISSLWQQLSSLQIEIGQYRSALTSLRELLSLNSQHIPSHYYYTLLLFMRRDFKNCQTAGNELFEKLQKINHFPKPALALLRSLDEKCGTRYLINYIPQKSSKFYK